MRVGLFCLITSGFSFCLNTIGLLGPHSKLLCTYSFYIMSSLFSNKSYIASFLPSCITDEDIYYFLHKHPTITSIICFWEMSVFHNFIILNSTSLITVDNHIDFQLRGGKANSHIKFCFYTALRQLFQFFMLSLNIPIWDCHDINITFYIFYLFWEALEISVSTLRFFYKYPFIKSHDFFFF